MADLNRELVHQMIWILWLLLAFVSPAHAQCNGVFAANTLCGNNSTSAKPPRPISGNIVFPNNVYFGSGVPWIDVMSGANGCVAAVGDS